MSYWSSPVITALGLLTKTNRPAPPARAASSSDSVAVTLLCQNWARLP